jgi:cell division initiation protein
MRLGPWVAQKEWAAMKLTPLDIQKMTFPNRFRGVDPVEVERFLELVAEVMTARLADIARLEQGKRELERRLAEAERKQEATQESLLHAQKLSQDIMVNARREAVILVKESEVAADTIVSQAIEQANKIESNITGLRTMRRDLQLKFKNTLDLFQHILEAEMHDAENTAVIRTLPRKRRTS